LHSLKALGNVEGQSLPAVAGRKVAKKFKAGSYCKPQKVVEKGTWSLLEQRNSRAVDRRRGSSFIIGLLPFHLLNCSTVLLLCRPFFNGLLDLTKRSRTWGKVSSAPLREKIVLTWFLTWFSTKTPLGEEGF
jgi:hypothetical protein